MGFNLGFKGLIAT